MDEETRDAAIEILEGMSERLEATFAEVAERHAPLRAEINALLEAAGSDKRFTADNFSQGEVLWALIPVIRRCVDKLNN